MAIAIDALSESHTSTTPSTSEASFSWNHTAAAGAKGLLVYVWTNADAGYITSVKWDSAGTNITVPAIVGGEAADTGGESGRCTAFLLTPLVTTGTKQITVTRTNNATAMYACAYTVLASSDEVAATGIVLTTGDAAVAEVAVTDGSPGANSLRFAGGHFGHQSPPATGASSTVGNSIDIGGQCFVSVYETTAGQGSRSVGMSHATTDDRAIVTLAIKEYGSSPAILTQLSTFSQGTLVVQIDNSFSPSHQLSTFSQGTPTVDLVTPVNLSTQLSTFSQGSPVARTDTSPSPSTQLSTFSQSAGSVQTSLSLYAIGLLASFSQGSISVTISSSVSPTGQVITASQGVVTENFDFSHSLSGQVSSWAQGTITVTCDSSFSPSTLLSSFSQGTLSVDAGGSNQNVNISTQLSSFSQGTPTVRLDSSPSLSTQLSTFAQSSGSVQTSLSVYPIGFSSTFSQGSISVRLDSSPSPSTQLSTFSQGTPSTTFDFAKTLTGLSSSFSQGSVTVNTAQTVSLSTLLSSFAQGTVTVTLENSAISVYLYGEGRLSTFSQAAGSVNTSLSVYPISLLSSFSQGSLAISISDVYISGLSSSFSQGSLSTIFGFSQALSGLSASFVQGTPTVSITGTYIAEFPLGRLSTFSQSFGSINTSLSVYPISLLASFSQGTIVVETTASSINYSPSGLSSSFSQGTILVTTGTLTGQSGTFIQNTQVANDLWEYIDSFGLCSFSQGSFISVGSTQSQVANVSTQLSSFAQGTLTLGVISDVSISGLSSSFSQGSISVLVEASPSLSTQLASFSQGSPSVSTISTISQGLIGLSSSFSQGSIVLTGLDVSVNLSGLVLGMTQETGFLYVSIGESSSSGTYDPETIVSPSYTGEGPSTPTFTWEDEH